MKKLLIVLLGMVFLLGAGGWLFAQPEATGYTISDIYYYLTEGTEATWGGHSLDPHSGVPGQKIEGFIQSLEDIYYFITDAYGQCDLTLTDFAGKGLTGKKYFSPDPENWGVVSIPGTPTPTTTPSPTPTPTPTTTPTPGWWEDYGPDGTGQVVKIGAMYVASLTAEAGCNFNARPGSWSETCSWGSNLDWLERSDWRLPESGELAAICANKERLNDYAKGRYWSATPSEYYQGWTINFDFLCQCTATNGSISCYMRAIRDVPE